MTTWGEEKPIDSNGVTCKEESVKSENAEDESEVFAEDECEVVRDDDQVTNDEMLNCAALVIGSSLVESNMVQSNSSSLDVYDDDGVYDKWKPMQVNSKSMIVKRVDTLVTC